MQKILSDPKIELRTMIGWSIGFNRGIDDGFDWIVRTIERLIAG